MLQNRILIGWESQPITMKPRIVFPYRKKCRTRNEWATFFISRKCRTHQPQSIWPIWKLFWWEKKFKKAFENINLRLNWIYLHNFWPNTIDICCILLANSSFWISHWNFFLNGKFRWDSMPILLNKNYLKYRTVNLSI